MKEQAATFPPIDHLKVMARLEWPAHPVDVVLDTDAYNEIDDQYAIAYLLLSRRLRTQAIYAAPFSNTRAQTPAIGMRKSEAEIHHILELMHREDLAARVFPGSDAYLPDELTPVDSLAARDLIARAMAHTPENPLYVVELAAITTVASALLIEPAIRDRVVIVWLGGHALHWPNNTEFNLHQDIAAARIVLGCGAAVVMLPCMGVVSAFATGETELRQWIKGQNALCDYLYHYTCDVAMKESRVSCWTRPIWDVTAVAWLENHDFMQDCIKPSPVPTYDGRWAIDPCRHPVRYVYHIQRDRLFEDLFAKLRGAK